MAPFLTIMSANSFSLKCLLIVQVNTVMPNTLILLFLKLDYIFLDFISF